MLISAKSERKPSLEDVIGQLTPVSGVVKGPDGKPLAGANIIIKGKNKGVTTDNNGQFTIDADQNDILIVSSVGYESKEVKDCINW